LTLFTKILRIRIERIKNKICRLLKCQEIQEIRDDNNKRFILVTPRGQQIIISDAEAFYQESSKVAEKVYLGLSEYNKDRKLLKEKVADIWFKKQPSEYIDSKTREAERLKYLGIN
jgi:hypothetical protein